LQMSLFLCDKRGERPATERAMLSRSRVVTLVSHRVTDAPRFPILISHKALFTDSVRAASRTNCLPQRLVKLPLRAALKTLRTAPRFSCSKR